MYRPPFDVTLTALGDLEEISRLVGRFEGLSAPAPQPMLRRENRIRTVQGSVSIEGNTLSLEQVTAVLEGKRVLGPPREVKEVQNALEAYALAPRLDPGSQRDLLRAHKVLMDGLAQDAGHWRTGGVAVWKGKKVAHVAPPFRRVPHLMAELLEFVREDTEVPALIRACVCHYELEFIHPFSDGNGRIGRLWQHVALRRVSPVFEHVPVESVIRARQQRYYEVLGASDKAGSSTAFLEFSLRALRDALEEFLEKLQPEPQTASHRLGLARDHFGGRWFSRKEYRVLHKRVSTATASRDLRQGVDDRALTRRGEKALAEYRFSKR